MTGGVAAGAGPHGSVPASRYPPASSCRRASLRPRPSAVKRTTTSAPRTAPCRSCCRCRCRCWDRQRPAGPLPLAVVVCRLPFAVRRSLRSWAFVVRAVRRWPLPSIKEPASSIQFPLAPGPSAVPHPSPFPHHVPPARSLLFLRVWPSTPSCESDILCHSGPLRENRASIIP